MVHPEDQLMTAKRDEQAPPALIIEFKTANGEVWGHLTADAKEFKTGSVGFYANGKVKNPKTGLAYQVGTNIILIGSKE
jgi:hypothetical protein